MPSARYFKQFGLEPSKTASARFAHRGGESRAARHWEWRALSGPPDEEADPGTGKGKDKGTGKGKEKGKGQGQEKGKGQGKEKGKDQGKK